MLDQLQSLVKQLTRNFIWSLSALLVLVGTVMLFATPGFSIGSFWQLVGTVLLEIGAVTLIIELLSLESLVSVKVPHVIFNHGYLQIANDDELGKLLDDVVRAKLGFPKLATGDLELGRDWLLHTLRTPVREDYRATIRLLERAIDERFGTDLVSGPIDGKGSLWIEIRYEYTTEQNLGNKAIPVNGDGVIHRVRDTIPNNTEFARKYRSGELATGSPQSHSQILFWIRNTVRPEVRLLDTETHQQVSTNYSIEDLVVQEDSDGLLWMTFSVKCDHPIRPRECVRVIYTQRWCVNPNDTHYWIAFARTRNFQFTAENFKGFDLLPIAVPARWSDESSLRVRGDMIIYTGMVYPNSTFAFAWSRVAS